MITLIGKNIAKEGLSFVFNGSSEECSTCRFKSSCVDSLDIGHRYKIVEVRDVEQKCPIHDDGKVKVVVVESAETVILTNPQGVFEGSVFTYTNNECSDEDCDFRDICVPDGFLEGDKCVYIKDLGKFKDCPKGHLFTKCIVKSQD